MRISKRNILNKIKCFFDLGISVLASTFLLNRVSNGTSIVHVCGILKAREVFPSNLF